MAMAVREQEALALTLIFGHHRRDNYHSSNYLQSKKSQIFVPPQNMVKSTNQS